MEPREETPRTTQTEAVPEALKKTPRKKRRNAEKRKFAAALIFLAVAIIAAIVVSLIGGKKLWGRLYAGAGLAESYPEPMENGATVYFFNVGQGDSSLVLVDGKSILIDSGEYDKAGKVISALRYIGVERLDYVIATHPHSDHIGCMAQVMREVPADTLIIQNTDAVTGSFKSMMTTAEKNGTSVVTISADEVITIGESCSVHIFRTLDDAENYNNNSLVVKLIYGGTSFLFCADIEEDAEQFLLDENADIDADVIKVPHHGSATSDNREFVEKVSPDYAVISVGEGNDYGHPHKAVVELYTRLGAKLYRTDMDGNVTAYSDGVNISFAA